MNELHTHFSHLYPFFALWYDTPSDLVFRDQGCVLRKIKYEEGVQQGDVAGPLLFCLGLKPSLGRLLSDLQGKHEGKGCFIGVFMEDVSIVFLFSSTHYQDDSILHIWKVSAARLQEFGLTLHPGKSSVHSPLWRYMQQCPYTCLPGIVPSLTGFRLCGGANGTAAYERAHFQEKVDEAKALGKAIEEYGDPRGAHLLFHFCVLPKLVYLTRIMGDMMQRADWAAADRELGESWVRVMGFSPMEWGQVSEQAYLSQYQGGLGFTHFDTV
uniref:Uncharacterized protein n=1 Tax=Chromera velia CCMP2878 TaxID=1169474 RepID=A0A0G4GRR7_9ALVE|eukprot:Cvel_23099.t1-p1 / transcript=Cvel_23099.t1 / gene=Cvel_23099 / organism=Chromera_velia_CCMP2878 / gene_product=hypothetical protein / transcript_product=hypothetical protein / location=Cvel_scaffold2343:22174-22977(-) / protein_length=268 / sequence_SO=supercontig / SO=protein_coding / is_pseudo=false